MSPRTSSTGSGLLTWTPTAPSPLVAMESNEACRSDPSYRLNPRDPTPLVVMGARTSSRSMAPKLTNPIPLGPCDATGASAVQLRTSPPVVEDHVVLTVRRHRPGVHHFVDRRAGDDEDASADEVRGAGRDPAIRVNLPGTQHRHPKLTPIRLAVRVPVPADEDTTPAHGLFCRPGGDVQELRLDDHLRIGLEIPQGEGPLHRLDAEASGPINSAAHVGEDLKPRDPHLPRLHGVASEYQHLPCRLHVSQRETCPGWRPSCR